MRALIVNRMHPTFGTGLAEAAAERAATLAGTDLGGLYRNLADFQLVASREEHHLAGLASAVAPAPGGARAVPADRRPRHRRAHRRSRR